MSFFIASIFWIIGIFVASFTLLPLITAIRFAIPYTKKLEREGHINSKHKIHQRYFKSCLIFGGAFLFVACITLFISDHGFRGFIGGSILALVFGFNKTGYTKDNFESYNRINQEDILS